LNWVVGGGALLVSQLAIMVLRWMLTTYRALRLPMRGNTIRIFRYVISYKITVKRQGSTIRWLVSECVSMWVPVTIVKCLSWLIIASNLGGLFLLHTIGNNRSVEDNDAWLTKYIFPGSVLPSAAQLSKSFDGLFVLEDWHNFGVDYDRTLMEWKQRFQIAWPRFRDQYGERFYRMWCYYLDSCAGCFRSRFTQLFQLVLSRGGVAGGWKTVR